MSRFFRTGSADNSQGPTTEEDPVNISRDDVSDYNQDNILPESARNIKRIRDWLRPTRYDIAGSEYRKHLDSHADGTGTWLTSSDTYQQWIKHESHGLLWIKGIPGSGKSVHAAKVISSLGEAYPDCPVLYFFFRQIIAANHEPQALARDWMNQLLEYSPPLQRRLMEYVEKGTALSTLASVALLHDLRQAFLSLPNKAFCVVDALDEMDDGNDHFIRELAALGLWRPKAVKVLMTSRPVPKVELPLRTTPTLSIRLDEDHVDKDISKYVKATLEVSKIPSHQWQIIMDAVPGKANGLFLYARLAMDDFLRPGADVQDVLSQLPSDLNVLYADLIESHRHRSSVSGPVQLLILQVITHSIRPLRLLELAELIRILDPDGQSRNLKDAKDLVRQACGPLLEILPDETVSVIHHSFTEYLTGLTRTAEPTGYQILKPGPTHDKLAQACLRYLLTSGCLEDLQGILAYYFDEKDGPGEAHGNDEDLLTRTRMKFPFYEYAATNWQVHIRAAEATDHPQGEAIPLLHEFFTRKEGLKCWFHMTSEYWSSVNDEDRESKVQDFSLLHIAAASGLAAYTRTLLENPDTTVVDSCDRVGRTPLWWAASWGHAATVKMLIAAGANPDHDEPRAGWKPLHEAASANHVDVMRVLIDAGVDPMTGKTKENPGRTCGNARRTTGDTAMRWACFRGHTGAVDVLLPVISLEEAQNALEWAVGSRKAEVVRRITRHPGINLDKVYGSTTSLYRACKNVDVAIVQILLEAGSNPEECYTPRRSLTGASYRLRVRGYHSPAAEGETALFGLCRSGSSIDSHRDETDILTIFRLLKDAGARVDCRSCQGRTALHESAKWSTVLTKLLLDAGVPATVSDEEGNTPLHECTTADLVMLLTEHGGAKVDAMNSKEQTPLSLALQSGMNEKALKLLELGADTSLVRTQDSSQEQCGALHLLLGRGHYASPSTALIKALLNSGADPNQRNREGKTVLMLPKSREKGVQDLLFEAGADVNARDYNGKTAFFVASAELDNDADPKMEYKTMRRLIGEGALIQLRDFRGRTCLHEALVILLDRWSRKRQRQGLNQWTFLIELGLDPKATDHHGNTLLHELAQMGEKSERQNWVSLVDSHGLDVDQQNHAGRTPLHVFCEYHGGQAFYSASDRLRSPINYLLETSKNVDAIDCMGVTALHIAATKDEYLTKRLLEAGADPRKVTHQNMSALHIAARAQQLNIVGLLLTALGHESATEPFKEEHAAPQSDSTSRSVSTPQVSKVIDWHDLDGRAALYYAVRSGRPETVALLLEAGADPDQGPKACLDFEAELSFINIAGRSQPRDLENKEIRLDAQTRVKKADRIRLEEHIARLEEILTMLVDHGADFSTLWYNKKSPQNGSLISNAARISPANTGSLLDRGYTAFCFTQLLSASDAEKSKRLLDSLRVPQIILPYSNVHGEKSGTPSTIPAYHSSENTFLDLMRDRKYLQVEECARKDGDFMSAKTTDKISHFGRLVSHGFTKLAKSIGDMEAAKGLKESKCHAFGDETEPGLWYVEPQGLLEDEYYGMNHEQEPLLMTAIRRNEPNLPMVKLLVERFKVNPNEPLKVLDWQKEDGPGLVEDETPLHYAARGEHWWHVHQALPYLLGLPGIDINAQIPGSGLTPLHLAVATGKGFDENRRDSGMYSHDAARILIEHGADLNAVAGASRSFSCLDMAGGNLDMIKLLLKHGQTISPDAVVLATSEGNIELLRLLLEAGADPNAVSHDQDVALYSIRGYRNRLETERRKSTSSQLPRDMARLLVKHGADPLAKVFAFQELDTPQIYDYVTKADAHPTLSLPDGQREGTVLHEWVHHSDCHYLPVLLGSGADINAKDAYGLTVLHILCLNGEDIHKHWSDVVVAEADKSDLTTVESDDEVLVEVTLSQEISSVKRESVLEHLLSLGADIMTRDYFDRNILMALFNVKGPSATPDDLERSLRSIIAKVPDLVNQADLDGDTPLMYAVRWATKNGKDWVRPIFRLLEAGADINCKNKSGDGLLHLVATNMVPDNQALFRELVAQGLDIEERNTLGRTSLFAFARRRRVPHPMIGSKVNKTPSIVEAGAVDLFKELQADFMVKDYQGHGLLHVAAVGDDSRFKELLALGLDPLDEDDMQQTAVDKAAASSNTAVLKLFEKTSKK